MEEVPPNMPPVGKTELESAPSAEEVQYKHEENAFKTHVETSQEQIPDNFENAEAWFASLKEAQKQYTQKSQELSDFKKSIEEQTPATPQPDPAPEDMLTNELRIPKEETQTETREVATGVTDELYREWSAELAAAGDFSKTTRDAIKKTTGFNDTMLNDYVDASKARLRETYSKAAGKVGGMDRLNKIFKWASSELSKDELQNINIGLSSPSYEVTLRGLASMYDSSNPESKRAAEPAPTPNLGQVPSSETGIAPYRSQTEFKKERNDPQFEYDPAFREKVQNKMAITDWNTLPLV